MNTMTTRSIAALAATGAIVVGGAAAANASTADDVGSKRSEVSFGTPEPASARMLTSGLLACAPLSIASNVPSVTWTP